MVVAWVDIEQGHEWRDVKCDFCMTDYFISNREMESAAEGFFKIAWISEVE